MNARRRFLKWGAGAIAFLGLAGGSALVLISTAIAGTKKLLLPKGTDPKTLVQKNPARLDTRNLDVMPLDQFGTMGLTDYEADTATWRLVVEAPAADPVRMTHAQLQALPGLERDVLLICPGIFVNHGRWKGFSIRSLLQRAGLRPGTGTHVTFRGPRGRHEYTKRFPVADVLSDRVFLAYGVNGVPLPRRHGFPLRVVAEGYYGYDWIKYVDRVTVEAVRETETDGD